MLRNIVVPCEDNPLPSREVEVDEFIYHYTASEKPHIQVSGSLPSHSYPPSKFIGLNANRPALVGQILLAKSS